jgi:hypothetical protein
MADDLGIFRAAHEGDLGPLIELLRSGAELTPDRRALVIKILEGKLNRPPHRQASLKTLQRQHAIARRVRELEHEVRKSHSAIVKAAEEFGCHEKTVRNAIREERENKKTVALASAVLRTIFYRIQNNLPGGVEALDQLASEMKAIMEDEYRQVGLTYVPRANTVAEAESFVRQLTEKK